MVIITGSRHFGIMVRDMLREENSRRKYLFIETWGSLAGKIAFLLVVPFASAIYLIGGEYFRSRVVEIALFLRKRVVMHWVGSDVLKAKKINTDGRHSLRYINGIQHLAEVEWIREELHAIGISAEVVPLYSPPIRKSSSFPKDQFVVSAYIAQGHESFYGFSELLALARDFPQISIRICNLQTTEYPLPCNVKLLGFVDDFQDFVSESHVFFRMPKHDGLAVSVLEALSCGRHVLYNKRFRGCIYVSCYNDLKENVFRLIKAFENNQDMLNADGLSVIAESFSRTTVATMLASHLGE